MRHSILLIAALLIPAAPAMAQVTIDLRALDALPHSGATARPAPHRPARPLSPHRRTAERLPPPPSAAPAAVASAPSAPAKSSPAPAATASSAGTPTATPPQQTRTVSAAPPPLPSMAAAPPAVAELTPIAPPPASRSEPPPPPPIAAGAVTKAAATNNGLRLTFGAQQSELSPDSAQSIRKLADAAKTDSNATFNVVAYAAATPGDPSVARRLSLSRALAVRSALMADGIDSSRIYVRALGSQTKEGPPDRVDVTMLGGNASAAPAR